MSDILAAFLCAQLRSTSRLRLPESGSGTITIRSYPVWAAEHKVQLPYVPPHCEQPYHMFYLVMPSLHARQGLI